MMISKFAILKIIAPSAYVKPKKYFPQKSLVFDDILHTNFSIGYILCNMKPSSCTQPFTEYICPVSNHKTHFIVIYCVFYMIFKDYSMIHCTYCVSQ